jgi:hypothetical protein
MTLTAPEANDCTDSAAHGKQAAIVKGAHDETVIISTTGSQVRRRDYRAVDPGDMAGNAVKSRVNVIRPFRFFSLDLMVLQE